MGIIVDNLATERTDVHTPIATDIATHNAADPAPATAVHKVVARGCLDMTAGGGAGAWVGTHPGFTDVITDNGAGDQTVHLSAQGAATMIGRATVVTAAVGGQACCAALAGATLQDLQVTAGTWAASDSNPGGWGAGAHLPATPIATDMVVLIEVISFA